MATEQELYQQYLSETQQAKPSDEQLYQQYLSETGQSSNANEKFAGDVSGSSRLNIFGTDSPEGIQSGIKYLTEKNPNLEFTQQDGEIGVREKGKGSFQKLPTSGFGWEDLAYNVPSALAEGAATVGGAALGALGGTAVAPGPGTIAGGIVGGSAAGGAAAAGTESLRQGIGKMMGINDELDAGQIGTSAAFGAAGPLIFGQGKSLKAGSKIVESLMERGLSKEAAESAIKTMDKGALSYGADAVKGVGAKALSTASGFTPEIIKGLPDKLQIIKAFEKGGGNRTEYVTTIGEKLNDAVIGERKAAGQALGDALGKYNAQVDLKDVNKPLQDLIGRYEGKVSELRDQLWEKFDGGKLDEMRAMVGDSPEGLAKLTELEAQITNKVERTLQKNDVFKNYNYVKDAVESKALPINVANGKQAIDYKDALNDITFLRQSDKALKDSTVDRDLARASTQAVSTLDRQIKDLGEDVNLREVYKRYADVSKDEQFISKQIRNKSGELDPEKVDGLLRSFGRDAKQVRSDLVMDLNNKYNAGIGQDLENDIFLKTFSNPKMSIMPFGGQNTTQYAAPLSAIGGMAGYQAGKELDPGNPWAPILTAAGGTLAARNIMSPAGLRVQAEIYKALAKKPAAMAGAASEVADKAIPYFLQRSPQMGVNIYNKLKENER